MQMIYSGMLAAQGVDQPRLYTLDPGLEVNTQSTGYLVGMENRFSTDYTYFAAALIVEMVCIALIAPTQVSAEFVSSEIIY